MNDTRSVEHLELKQNTKWKKSITGFLKKVHFSPFKAFLPRGLEVVSAICAVEMLFSNILSF